MIVLDPARLAGDPSVDLSVEMVDNNAVSQIAASALSAYYQHRSQNLVAINFRYSNFRAPSSPSSYLLPSDPEHHTAHKSWWRFNNKMGSAPSQEIGRAPTNGSPDTNESPTTNRSATTTNQSATDESPTNNRSATDATTNTNGAAADRDAASPDLSPKKLDYTAAASEAEQQNNIGELSLSSAASETDDNPHTGGASESSSKSPRDVNQSATITQPSQGAPQQRASERPPSPRSLSSDADSSVSSVSCGCRHVTATSSLTHLFYLHS
jgi:hypothetical protein